MIVLNLCSTYQICTWWLSSSYNPLDMVCTGEQQKSVITTQKALQTYTYTANWLSIKIICFVPLVLRWLAHKVILVNNRQYWLYTVGYNCCKVFCTVFLPSRPARQSNNFREANIPDRNSHACKTQWVLQWLGQCHTEKEQDWNSISVVDYLITPEKLPVKRCTSNTFPL